MARRRRKARTVCLQMLYQQDMNPDVDARTVREMMREQLPDEDLYQFAWRLFVGVMEWRATLDHQIEEVAENWSLSRMAPTDRNVLRLGAFEMIYLDTPPAVAIDEAIELARSFGTKQSSQFVNGILDRLRPPDAETADSAEPPE